MIVRISYNCEFCHDHQGGVNWQDVFVESRSAVPLPLFKGDALLCRVAVTDFSSPFKTNVLVESFLLLKLKEMKDVYRVEELFAAAIDKSRSLSRVAGLTPTGLSNLEDELRATERQVGPKVGFMPTDGEAVTWKRLVSLLPLFKVSYFTSVESING